MDRLLNIVHNYTFFNLNDYWLNKAKNNINSINASLNTNLYENVLMEYNILIYNYN